MERDYQNDYECTQIVDGDVASLEVSLIGGGTR
jgi:hypothetical protein